MPKKPAKTAPEGNGESILTETARAIGSVAGKVVAVVSPAPEPSTDKSPAPRKPKTVGKLPKKNKQRLPRKQKKAEKKAAAQASRSR